MGLMTTMLGRGEAGELRAIKASGGHPSSPAYWVAKLFGQGEDTASGVDVNEDTALTYTAVWAAVNIIAGSVSTLPLSVFRRIGAGDKEPYPDHPIQRLIHTRPNEYMDSQTFRETLTGHVLTWGNGQAEIERDNGGRPIALWPLPPNRVEPKFENGQLWYEVTLPNGKMVPIAPANMLHIHGLGFDGFKGYSPIRYHIESIGLGLATTEYGAGFFGSKATPSGLLMTDGKVTEPEAKRLTDTFDKRHGGLDHKQRTALLSGGLKWQQIAIPPEDAQFLETRRHQVGDIARIYQIPPHMLADLERATFSNIAHQRLEFHDQTLLRYLNKWEFEIGFKLFLPVERDSLFVKHNVDALLRTDIKTRYAAYAIGRQWGWLSINEIRRLEDMNAIDEGGDVYLSPMNMEPADSVGEDDEKPETEGTPPEEPEADADDKGDEGARTAAMVEAITQAHRGAFADVIGRMVTKETRAATRAAEKDPRGLVAWADRFYREHERTYRLRMIPPVEAYAGALRALTGKPPDQGFLTDVGMCTANLATEHMQVAPLPESDRMEAWILSHQQGVNEYVNDSMERIRSCVLGEGA